MPPSAQSEAEIRSSSGMESGMTLRTASTTARVSLFRPVSSPPQPSVRSLTSGLWNWCSR